MELFKRLLQKKLAILNELNEIITNIAVFLSCVKEIYVAIIICKNKYLVHIWYGSRRNKDYNFAWWDSFLTWTLTLTVAHTTPSLGLYAVLQAEIIPFLHQVCFWLKPSFIVSVYFLFSTYLNSHTSHKDSSNMMDLWRDLLT